MRQLVNHTMVNELIDRMVSKKWIGCKPGKFDVFTETNKTNTRKIFSDETNIVIHRNIFFKEYGGIISKREWGLNYEKYDNFLFESLFDLIVQHYDNDILCIDNIKIMGIFVNNNYESTYKIIDLPNIRFNKYVSNKNLLQVPLINENKLSFIILKNLLSFFNCKVINSLDEPQYDFMLMENMKDEEKDFYYKTRRVRQIINRSELMSMLTTDIKRKHSMKS